MGSEEFLNLSWFEYIMLHRAEAEQEEAARKRLRMGAWWNAYVTCGKMLPDFAEFVDGPPRLTKKQRRERDEDMAADHQEILSMHGYNPDGTKGATG